MRILLVEDDRRLAHAIGSRLAATDYAVNVTRSGPLAQAAYEHFQPELVLLDLDDSSASDCALIPWIRSRSTRPIIVLSTRAVEHATVAALELGADDYITKPFGLGELIARVRVALRHVAQPTGGAAALVQVGDLELDVERQRVERRGQPVHLTPTEYELLKLFALHPDKLLTDQMLLDGVWGRTRRPHEHTLHVYIARLRQKIEPDPKSPKHLLTETAAGYRLASAANRPATSL